MQFAIAVITGILVGAVLVLATLRSAPSAAHAVSRSAWLTLALGAASVAIFGIAVSPFARDTNVVMAAIAVPVATVVLGANRLVHKDHRWQVWTGLILGAVPTLLWVVFLGGELLGLAH
jgi:hypothetical protein